MLNMDKYLGNGMVLFFLLDILESYYNFLLVIIYILYLIVFPLHSTSLPIYDGLMRNHIYFDICGWFSSIGVPSRK